MPLISSKGRTQKSANVRKVRDRLCTAPLQTRGMAEILAQRRVYRKEYLLNVKQTVSLRWLPAIQPFNDRAGHERPQTNSLLYEYF